MLIVLRFPYSFLEISCSIEKSITRSTRLTIEKTLKFSCFMAKAKFAQCYSAHSHWAACACIIHVAMKTWLDWPPGGPSGVWLAWASLLSILQNTRGKWRCRSALVKLNGNAGSCTRCVVRTRSHTNYTADRAIGNSNLPNTRRHAFERAMREESAVSWWRYFCLIEIFIEPDGYFITGLLMICIPWNTWGSPQKSLAVISCQKSQWGK